MVAMAHASAGARAAPPPGAAPDTTAPATDDAHHSAHDSKPSAATESAQRTASALDEIRPAYFYPVDAYTDDGAAPADDAPADDAPEDAVQHSVPVFTPTMEQFVDFYAFCQAIDRWGMQSGIVKVIPPKEWRDALPSLGMDQRASPDTARVDRVRIKNAITQHFLSAGPGRWKQTNVTRAKVWDAKQWADVCQDARHRGPPMARVRAKAEAAVAAEQATAQSRQYTRADAPLAAAAAPRPPPTTGARSAQDTRRAPPRARNAATSDEEWAAFDYRLGWTHEAQADADDAPPAPSAWDARVCRAIEAEYWRSLNLGHPPMYGADLQGTLFDARTTSWNVGTLDSLLSRRLQHALPGVTTPYLYFGMWRASFAWHVEDMDLYSINYIHFGAPKQWYAIRQADRQRFESVMASAFPADSRQCAQFLRHKSFLASPTFLASQGVRPLRLVQHAQEFVLTYPYGYHAGYNLGYNCAESVNFALPTWLDVARTADYCKCPLAQESVHFDPAAFLDAEDRTPPEHAAPAKAPRTKRARLEAPAAPAYACVFCVSPADAAMAAVPPDAAAALARTPAARKSHDAAQERGALHAHELCAAFIPETYLGAAGVQGAADIERARWQLKCQLCRDAEAARHGAKIQCTKGKCPRAAHVGCALEEDSGWLLDMVPEADAARLEGRKAGDGASAERLVVLCRTHNPRRQEAEAARRDAQLVAAVEALEMGAWVRVKAGRGVWASRVRALDAAQRVAYVDEDPDAPAGGTIGVPWARLQLGAPAPAQAPVEKVEEAYVLECKVPVRRAGMSDPLCSDARAQAA
ncbi:hypothetical protein MOBT1_001915 [Malassezia obtusa]|uniref:[histone H3]-trimethyl-L-lysine(9) demethylase n=1 Tax=Malassezia obtusa TaxID=76774 RepID=A0AAF0DZY9_9BASI|nr:hypothetical protein MOBT1_001915 [Malassezia obtusa]